jgi:hypothetical protein
MPLTAPAKVDGQRLHSSAHRAASTFRPLRRARRSHFRRIAVPEVGMVGPPGRLRVRGTKPAGCSPGGVRAVAPKDPVLTRPG